MDVAPIIAGSALTATLLLIEHVLLWEYRDRIRKPIGYAIGTLTIAAGIALISALTGRWESLTDYLAVLLPGGAIISAAYAIRSERHTPADELREEGEYVTLPGARRDRRN